MLLRRYVSTCATLSIYLQGLVLTLCDFLSQNNAGNDFLPHLPSLDIRDGAIDFLIESYKEMLPSLGNYVTSPGGAVNLQQADVILGRVGEVEDEVFRRKKGAEDNEERKRASFFKNPRGSGPGGVILAPKDRARAEAESMVRMVQDGMVTNAQPPRPTSQYRSDHPQTFPNSSAEGADAATATGNLEAAQRLKGSILGKRRAAAAAVSSDTDHQIETKPETTDVDVELPVTVSSNAGDPDADKDSSVCDMQVEVKPVLTAEEAAKTKEDIKKRMKAKESEMIDGYKKSMKDNVCLHESGWKSR